MSEHDTVYVTRLDAMKPAFAGGISGAITRFICQPLDVIKIRFQLQVEPLALSSSSSSMSSSLSTATTATTSSTLSSTKSKYHSFYQAFKLIVHEEGLNALWKGHNVAQVLSICYGIGQFTCYENLNKYTKHYEFFRKNDTMRTFLCGAIAGSCGTIISTPLDVVRTRLIAQDNNSTGYRNSFDGLIKIYKSEGVRGLYRGMIPAVLQIAPLTGANFMFYALFCNTLQDVLKLKSRDDLTAIELFLTGGLAGISSKTIIYPLDLAKKRLQIQGFSEYRQTFGKHFECDGLITCISHTIKYEGFVGLYKGLLPSVIKSGLTTALSFCMYDEIMRIITTD